MTEPQPDTGLQTLKGEESPTAPEVQRLVVLQTREVITLPDSARQPLDNLNPVTRLALTFILTMPLLLTLDWVSAGVAVALDVLVALAVGFRGWRQWRRVVPLLVLAPLAGLSMILYADPAGSKVHWSAGLIVVSDQSLLLGAAVALRLLAIALPAVLLLPHLDATATADGLVQLWHLPPRLVLGTLAGIRLVATFAADWQLLSLARRARGLGGERSLKRLFQLAFSLLVIALRRGGRVSTAMEARGLDAAAGRRTWARESKLTRSDWVALLVGLLMVAGALAAAIAAGTFSIIGG